MSRSSSTERARSDSEEDAALVLGDLVRIGEASRLRRRGALRLDLSTAATTPDDELAALAAAADTQPFTYRVYCGAQRWTGCQALVHDRAAPSTRDATWVARGRAQPAVVRLGAAYFARGGRKVRRPCGCASDGVGCRVCGNALGSVWRPCARHGADAGPLYAFFAAATDSEPAFAFPPPVVPPPPLNSPGDPLPTSPVLVPESPKL